MLDLRPTLAIGVPRYLLRSIDAKHLLGEVETRLTGGSDLAIVYRAITD
jgi:hypothetical protein